MHRLAVTKPRNREVQDVDDAGRSDRCLQAECSEVEELGLTESLEIGIASLRAAR